MTTRSALVEAGAEVLTERGEKAAADPLATMEAIADRLGLREEPDAPQSWLFVRRDDWAPIEVLRRFDGAIIPVRSPRGILHREPSYWLRARAAGVEVVGMDWMLEPGRWREGLASTVAFLASVGARGFCINAEPRPKGYPRRWEGQREEAHAYAVAARDLCDRHRLQLWFSSWAMPRARESFPWADFIRPAHVCIPQPYEVHGRAGPGYVAEVLGEWRELGAREMILGRGAHELDPSDADHWRTRAEVTAHRASTPRGMSEAWWTPAGPIPAAVLDAMVSPPKGG